MLFNFYHGGSKNPADANRDPLTEDYDFLVTKMTPTQIAKSKKLAKEWKPADVVDQQDLGYWPGRKGHT
jgi:hypothetical protein